MKEQSADDLGITRAGKTTAQAQKDLRKSEDITRKRYGLRSVCFSYVWKLFVRRQGSIVGFHKLRVDTAVIIRGLVAESLAFRQL